MKNYLKKRIKAFGHAFRGVQDLLKGTPHAVIHLIMALLAILLGILLRITPGEWVAVVIVIGLVFALEAINSAIEALADRITLEQDERIRRVKDLSAAAVFLAAIAALVVGVIIFVPKLIGLL